MSWMQRLYETYENCQSMVGKIEDDNKVPLLPICHTTQKAQIEIVIDGEGNFLRARIVPKEQARTIIPCTEASGGRTSGEAAHPLCDKLQYVAADYKEYTGEEAYFHPKIVKDDFKVLGNKIPIKSLIANLESNGYVDNVGIIKESFGSLKNFNELNVDAKCKNRKERVYEILLAKNSKAFKRLLSDWVRSRYVHPKVVAVYKYVQRGKVIEDLIANKILYVNPRGMLLKKRQGKKQNNDQADIFDLLPGRENKKKDRVENWQADAFVRWVVEINGEKCSKTWEDRTLWDSWINYYSNRKNQRGLCYVTGEEKPYAEQHPAKLRNDGDKAKIISSNDWDGFTFRGRFTDTKEDNTYQSCGIGFDVTQKAHSALRWLISRQGKVFYVKAGGGKSSPALTIVAWSVMGKPLPNPLDDPFELLGMSELVSDRNDVVVTSEHLAQKLKQKISGYKADLGDTDSIVVMGIDSATQGRMAIIYYQKLTGSDFLERLNHWHETCAWVHDYGYDDATEKNYRFVGAPSPKDISWAAYGRRLGDDGKIEVESKVLKMTVERLLPCIIDGQKVPFDIVRSVVDHTCNRHRFKKSWEWEKTLSIACALYKKYNEKEGYIMSWDEKRKTRDYLFGGLLASADCLEKFALYVSEKNRPTNAARLMQRFSDKPCSTWKTVELVLAPYKARLGGRAKKFTDVFDELLSKFDPSEDFISDKPLSGEFLLGYHCMREKLKPKKNDPQDIDDTNDNQEEQ